MPLDLSSSDFDFNQSEPQVDLPEDDFSSAYGIVRGKTWAGLDEQTRGKSKESAFKLIRQHFEEDKSRTVKVRMDDGEEKEMKMWMPNGQLSDFGEEYLQKQKRALDYAAERPFGGLTENPITGGLDVDPMLSGLFDNTYTPKGKRPKGMFDDYDQAKEEAASVMVDGKPQDLTWEKYVEFKNRELPKDSPAALDPENEQMKERFESYKRLRDFDPKSLGDNYIGETEGQKQFNPDKMHDIVGMKKAIDESGSSDSEKFFMKNQYRKLLNQAGAEMLKEAGYAEGMSHELLKGSVAAPLLKAVGGKLKDAVGMERQDLFSKWERHAAESGGDFFSFVEANPELFDKEQYGWGDKLTNSLYKAFSTTGLGLGMLATGFQSETVKQWAVSVDEVSSGAYDGMGADWEGHGPFGITISEKGMYDMAGQVLSILATGGAGALVKGGIKGGTASAGLVAGEGGAKVAAGQLAGKAAIATAKAGAGVVGSVAGGAIGSNIGEEIGGETGERIGGVLGGILGGTAGIGGVSALQGRGVKSFVAEAIAKSEKKQLELIEKLAPETAKSLWGKDGKLAKYGLQALHDPSAYIGSLQAGGMTYGSTYNEVLRATGDRDLAARKATIGAIGSMASAYVATAVFNRIAAGAEGFMAGPRVGFGGSIKSAIDRRNFMAALPNAKARMEAFKAVMRDTVQDGKMMKALGAGLSEVLGRKAGALGMRKWIPLGGMVSEGFEEATDEILNDVFTAVLDKSETWNENVWENIEAKIGQYLSAGVMGALGGALGGGISGTTEIYQATRAERVENIKKAAELTWKGIEGEFEQFNPNVAQIAKAAGVDQSTLTVAEYIANSKDSVEKKAQVVMDAVFGSRMQIDMANLITKKGMKAEPEDGAEKAPELPQTAQKDAEGSDAQKGATTQQEQSSAQIETTELIEALGFKVPEGREVEDSVKVSPQTDPKGKPVVDKLGENETLTPLQVGEKSYAAAKWTKSDGTEEYVSHKKAIELLAATNKNHKSIPLYDKDGGVDQEMVEIGLTRKSEGGAEPSAEGANTAGGSAKPSEQVAQKDSNQQAAGTKPKQARGKEAASPSTPVEPAITPKPKAEQKLETKSIPSLDQVAGQKVELTADQRAKIRDATDITKNPDPIKALTDLANEAKDTDPDLFLETRRELQKLTGEDKFADTKLQAAEPKDISEETREKPHEVFVSQKLIEPEDIKVDDAGVDNVGGKWTREGVGSPLFDYDPVTQKQTETYKDYVYRYKLPKGANIRYSDFQLIQVYENNDVLILDKVENDTLVFRKVSLDSAIDSQGVLDVKKRDAASRKWEQTLLSRIETRLKEAMPKMFAPDSSTMTKPEFEKLFKQVLELVAPGMASNSVVFRKLENGFVHVETSKQTVTKSAPTLPPLAEAPELKAKTVESEQRIANAKKDIKDARADLKRLDETDMAQPETVTEETENQDADYEARRREELEQKIATAEQVIKDEEQKIKDEEVILEKPVIVVDSEAFVSRMRHIFKGYTPRGDTFYDGIVAMELGRQMARIIDEEVIHVIAKPEFKAKELEQFVDEALSGDARMEHIKKKVQLNSQLRFKKDAAELTPQEKHVVAHETLRELMQLITSGVTTEIQYADAKLIAGIADMNADDPVNGKIRTVISLLKRFWNNLRRLLNERRLRKNLTTHQRGMLNRLEALYERKGIRGDVDLIQQKAIGEANYGYAYAREYAEQRLNKIVKESNIFGTLQELKAEIRMLQNASIEDALEINPDTGAITLTPLFKEMLQDTGSTIDVKEVEDALDVLSFHGAARESVAILIAAEERLDLSRAGLPSAPKTGEDFLTYIRRIAAPSTYGKRAADAEGNPDAWVEQVSSKDDFDALADILRAEREQAEAKHAYKLMQLDDRAIKRVANLNVRKLSDRKKMIRIAGELGIYRDRVDDPDERITSQELQQAVISNLTAMVEPSEDPTLVATKEGTVAQRLQRFFPESLNIPAFDDSGINSLMAKIEEARKNPPTDAVVGDEFTRVTQYVRALRDYNNAARSLINNAIGDFSYFEEGFGESFRDVTDASGSRVVTMDDVLLDSEKASSGERDLSSINGYKYVKAADQYSDEEEMLGIDKENGQAIYNSRFYGAGGPRPSRSRNPLLNSIAKSNAAAQGKMAFQHAYDATAFVYDPNYPEYERTAGFNMPAQDQEGKPVAKRPDEYFARMDVRDLMYGVERFKRNGRYVNAENMLNALAWHDQSIEGEGYSSYLKRIEQRLHEIENMVDAGQMINEFGGKETLGARQALVLRARIAEAKEYLEAHNADVRSLYDTLKSKPDNAVTVAKEIFEDKGTKQAKNREILAYAIHNLNADLSFAKHAFDSFQRPYTRRLIKQGRIKRQRESIYEMPTDAVDKATPSPIDLPTRANYSFSLRTLAKHQSKYNILGVTASEMMQSLNRMAFSNDHEQLLQKHYTRYQKERTYETDDDGSPKEWESVPKGMEVFVGRYINDQLYTKDDGTIFTDEGFAPSSDMGTFEDYVTQAKLDPNGFVEIRFPNYMVFRVNADGTASVPRGSMTMTDASYSFFGVASGTRSPRFSGLDSQLTAISATQALERDATDLYNYKVVDKDSMGHPIKPFEIGTENVTADEWQILQSERKRHSVISARNKWFTRNVMLAGLSIPVRKIHSFDADKAVDRAMKFLDEVANVNKDNAYEIAYKVLAGLSGQNIDEAWRRHKQIMRGDKNKMLKRDAGYAEALDSLFAGYMDSYGFSINVADPVEFFADIVAYKALMEQDVMEKARIEGEDSIVNAMATVAAQAEADTAEEFASFSEAFKEKTGRDFFPSEVYDNDGIAVPFSQYTMNTEEASAILRQMRQDTNKDKKPNLYGLGAVNGVDFNFAAILDHPVLGTLVQALPGEVVIYQPDRAAMVGDSPVPVQIIPSANGGPTIIYAPKGAPKGNTSQMLATTLKLISDGNPQAKTIITSWGMDVFDTLQPLHALKKLNHKREASVKKLLPVAEAIAGRNLPLGQKSEEARNALVMATLSHLQEMMRSTEAFDTVQRLVDYSAKDPVGGSALLIAEILTNPKLKKLYSDLTYDDGTSMVQPTKLSEAQLLNVVDMVMTARRSELDGEENRGDEWESENRDVESALEAARENMEDSEQMEELQSINATLQEMAEMEAEMLEEANAAAATAMSLLVDDGSEDFSDDTIDDAERMIEEYVSDPELLTSGQVDAQELRELIDAVWSQVGKSGFKDKHVFILKNIKGGLQIARDRVEGMLLAMKREDAEHGQISNALHDVLNAHAQDLGERKLEAADVNLINMLTGLLETSQANQTQTKTTPTYGPTAIYGLLQSEASKERLEDSPDYKEIAKISPAVPARKGFGYQVGSWESLTKVKDFNLQSKLSKAFEHSRHSQIRAGILSLAPEVSAKMKIVGDAMIEANAKDSVDEIPNVIDLSLQANELLMVQMSTLLPRVERAANGEGKLMPRMKAALIEERAKIAETLKRKQTLVEAKEKLSQEIRELQAAAVADISQIQDTQIPADQLDEITNAIAKHLDDYILKTDGYGSEIADRVGLMLSELSKRPQIKNLGIEIAQMANMAAQADESWWSAKRKKDGRQIAAAASEASLIHQELDAKLEELEHLLNEMIENTFDHMLAGKIGIRKKTKEAKSIWTDAAAEARAKNPNIQPRGLDMTEVEGEPHNNKFIRLPRTGRDFSTSRQVIRAIEGFALNPSPSTYAKVIRSSVARIGSQKALREGFAESLVSAIQKVEGELSGDSRGVKRLAAGKLSGAKAFIDLISGERLSSSQKTFDNIVRDIKTRFRGQTNRAEAQAAIKEFLQGGLFGRAQGENIIGQIIQSLYPTVDSRIEAARELGLAIPAELNQQLSEKLAQLSETEQEMVNNDRTIHRMIIANSSPQPVGWTFSPVRDSNGERVPHYAFGTDLKVNANLFLAPDDFRMQFPQEVEETRQQMETYIRGRHNMLTEKYAEGTLSVEDFEYLATTNAIVKEIDRYVQNEAEDVYKFLRGEQSYMSDFDVAAIARQTAMKVDLERKMVESRMDRMKKQAEGRVLEPGLGHLGVDVLTALTSPDLDNQLISVSTQLTKAQGRLNKLNRELDEANRRYKQHMKDGMPTLTNKKRRADAKKHMAAVAKRIEVLKGLISDEQAQINKVKMKRAQQIRVRQWVLPKNKDARRDAIARIIKIDGDYVALGPVSMSEDLRNKYLATKRGPKNVNELVLQAMEPEIEAYELQALDPESLELTGKDMRGMEMSRIDFRKDYLDAASDVNAVLWDGSKKVGTKGLSRREVGELAERTFIQGIRNEITGGKEEIPFSTDPTQVEGFLVNKVEKHFGYMVRTIFQANNHPNLTPSTQSKIDDFIKGMEPADGKNTPKHFLRDNAKDLGKNMREMNLMDVFSSVMADIEGEYISGLLEAGLFKGHQTHDFKLMNFLNHEDSRFRQRFITDFIAMQEAVRLRSLLDRGFDQASGRNGAQDQHKTLSDYVAKSLKKVGNDSLDHTRAYMIASLQGILEHRYHDNDISKKLGYWIENFQKGAYDLMRFEKEQKARFKNPLTYANKATHVDLIRDAKMTQEVAIMLAPLIKRFHEGAPEAGGGNEHARSIIAEMQQVLLKGTDKATEIQNHANLLNKVFRGLTDAMAVTKIAMAQKESAGETASGEKISRHISEKKEPFLSRNSYSTVPLKFQYAANPNDDAISQHTEGADYDEDPLDTVRLEESALFGGFGTHEKKKGNAPYRPIHLNGAGAVDSILKDTIYRINVAPTYGVLRRVFGREVKSSSGVSMVSGDAKIFEQFANVPNWQQENKYKRAAIAALNREMENIVENDAQIGVFNTHVSEAMRVGASLYTVRALLSPWQLLYQTVPAIAGFGIKNLFTGAYAMWTDRAMSHKYWTAISNMFHITRRMFVTSIGDNVKGILNREMPDDTVFNPEVSGRSFNKRASTWIKQADPWLSFRGADGMDQNRSVLRNQKRHGVGFLRMASGLVVKKIEAIGEKGLDMTIGAGERLLARSIYLTELISELNEMKRLGVIQDAPTNVEDLLSIPPNAIPTEAKDYARMKVNDMMGIADQSKKAWMFQSHSRHATLQALTRSAVRFSNHTATTSSNASVLMRSLPGLWKAAGDDQASYSQRRQAVEALENITGTLSQNMLFHMLKAGPFLSILAYAIYRIQGDDEDEATERAASFVSGFLNPDEEMDSWDDYVKLLTMGRQAEFFQDWKEPEAARKSAWATMTSKMFAEMIQIVPFYGIGAIFGYSPANTLAKSNVLNPFSESLLAIGEDIEVGRDNSDRSGVRIYERDMSWHESLAEVTNPSAFFHDLASSLGIFGKSLFLDDSDYFASAMYLLSQGVAPREVRGGLEKLLKEKIREEED